MSERECRTFEKKLVHFTAPTLLGIKCASLVSLSREEFDIPAYAAAFNAQAVRGGLQMQIMCLSEAAAGTAVSPEAAAKTAGTAGNPAFSAAVWLHR